MGSLDYLLCMCLLLMAWEAEAFKDCVINGGNSSDLLDSLMEVQFAAGAAFDALCARDADQLPTLDHTVNTCQKYASAMSVTLSNLNAGEGCLDLSNMNLFDRLSWIAYRDALSILHAYSRRLSDLTRGEEKAYCLYTRGNDTCDIICRHDNKSVICVWRRLLSRMTVAIGLLTSKIQELRVDSVPPSLKLGPASGNPFLLHFVTLYKLIEALKPTVKALTVLNYLLNSKL